MGEGRKHLTQISYWKNVFLNFVLRNLSALWVRPDKQVKESDQFQQLVSVMLRQRRQLISITNYFYDTQQWFPDRQVLCTHLAPHDLWWHSLG